MLTGKRICITVSQMMHSPYCRFPRIHHHLHHNQMMKKAFFWKLFLSVQLNLLSIPSTCYMALCRRDVCLSGCQLDMRYVIEFLLARQYTTIQPADKCLSIFSPSTFNCSEFFKRDRKSFSTHSIGMLNCILRGTAESTIIVTLLQLQINLIPLGQTVLQEWNLQWFILCPLSTLENITNLTHSNIYIIIFYKTM